MKILQTSVDRLANYLKKSRDAWKERALQKQERLRSLEIKVRDLSASRDYWKNKAKEAEKIQHEIVKKKPSLKKNSELGNVYQKAISFLIKNTNLTEDRVIEGELIKANEKSKPLEKDNIVFLPPARHSYPLFIIQLAVQQVICASLSLRSCERHFQILNAFFHLSPPSFSSIRQWLFRIGLYVLQKEQQYRSDWIMIVDSTIELGSAKCLVILGIPHAHLASTNVNAGRSETTAKKNFVLQHQEVQVLSIEVLTKINGEVINDKLETLSKRVGIPKQIIADHGSDIKKGIKIYQEKHEDTIYTYDITHQMALFLKYHLENDKRYQEFAHKCHKTASSIQQTNLHFLKPPAARSKARWLNVATHVQWAEQVLAYEAAGDFSLIDPTFVLDGKAYRPLLDTLDQDICKRLITLLDINIIYPSRASFSCAVRDCIGKEEFERYGIIICEAASKGRRYFYEKLGWLANYKDDIAIYSEMIEIIQKVQKQVKQQGLSQTSRVDFENSIKDKVLKTRSNQLKEQILGYLAQEVEKIPSGQTFLGTSDIIESIFGRYKQHTAKNPLREIGKMILTIPLFVTKITSEIAKEAMESVSTADVKKWADKLFGSSALSKRRSAFKLKKPDIEVA